MLTRPTPGGTSHTIEVEEINRVLVQPVQRVSHDPELQYPWMLTVDGFIGSPVPKFLPKIVSAEPPWVGPLKPKAQVITGESYEKLLSLVPMFLST